MSVSILEEQLRKTNATLDRVAQMQAEDREAFRRWLEKQEQWLEVEKTRREAEEEAEKKKREDEWNRIKEYIRRVQKEVGGISKGNALMAEEYFFYSLERSKTFGGIHFDDVDRNVYEARHVNRDLLIGEYDIVMTNKDAVCVLEVKYRVRTEDVARLSGEIAKNFRLLFPQYANMKLYLGIGGMSFEGISEKRAKELGIGILKLNGDAVEIDDTELKAY